MRPTRLIGWLIVAAALSGCATTHRPAPGLATTYNPGNLKPYTVRGQTYYPNIPETGYTQTGLASWYGPESGSSRTADGETFDPDGISAAHTTFPLPSLADVTNLATGKTIRVRINDRGPFSGGRIIDLSRGAAKALGVTGIAKVRVKWLGPASRDTHYATTGASRASAFYIVQLGAFSDKENATRILKRMTGARIDQRQGLYIVYLGPYDGAAAAEVHRQSAIDTGFADAILQRAP